MNSELTTDILITAVEGGINYWAGVEHYEPKLGVATVMDSEEGDTTLFRVTLGDLYQALIDIDADPTPHPERLVEAVRGALRTGETCPNDGSHEDLDADLCDQILQVAIFGSVIYG